MVVDEQRVIEEDDFQEPADYIFRYSEGQGYIINKISY